MKVLLGLDGSPYSLAALEFVRRGSWQPDTTFRVVSSVTLPASAYVANLGGMEIGTWLDELTRYCQEVVSHGEELLRTSGLRVESRVLQGDPRETLVEEAREQHVDLIIVGSHGRTGLEKLMMGSVASHVVTHAPCSVLVVRAEAK